MLKKEDKDGQIKSLKESLENIKRIAKDADYTNYKEQLDTIIKEAERLAAHGCKELVDFYDQKREDEQHG